MTFPDMAHERRVSDFPFHPSYFELAALCPVLETTVFTELCSPDAWIRTPSTFRFIGKYSGKDFGKFSVQSKFHAVIQKPTIFGSQMDFHLGVNDCFNSDHHFDLLQQSNV